MVPPFDVQPGDAIGYQVAGESYTGKSSVGLRSLNENKWAFGFQNNEPPKVGQTHSFSWWAYTVEFIIQAWFESSTGE